MLKSGKNFNHIWQKLAIKKTAHAKLIKNPQTEKVTPLDRLSKKYIIKTMNQSTGKKTRKEIFYVVTRNGRRAWPKNYWTLSEAQNHAESLSAALNLYHSNKLDKISIVETSDPESIN